MHTSLQDPVALFDDHVPQTFLHDTLLCLVGCYKQAFSQARVFYPWQVAHDYRPYLRRAEFEKQWLSIVQNHSSLGIHGEYCQNCARNCWHLLVTCGQVLLTQSFVDQKLKSVRRAMFRDGYARRNESFLFPDMAPPAPTSDAPLYAILSHDGVPDQSRPMTAEIIFPDPEGQIVARINLAKRFPDLFLENEAVVEEVVGSDPDIDLRDDVKAARKTV